MTAYKARINEFRTALSQPVIALDHLKRLCFHGIPDEEGIRSDCWRYLLNYLPPCKAEAQKVLEEKRLLYKQFIDDLIVCPNKSPDDSPTDNCRDVTNVDHPLSIDPESQWRTFFNDNEFLLQIDKDVRRLCPDMVFFQQATDYPQKRIVDDPEHERLHQRVEQKVLRYANIERRGLGATRAKSNSVVEDLHPLGKGKEAHWEVVERILFLYAKLNPGQGYVQGMNEVIGPLYYVLASDPRSEYREHAEPDCFFLFTLLMAEIRDFFIRSLDEAQSGIKFMMERLGNLLRSVDFDLWKHLERQELKLHYFAFRWLTLLLSQEFPLPDVVRIWDSLFADGDRFNFLLYVCCSMILVLRDQLLGGDFSNNVKLLQNFPPMDLRIVLSKAIDLQSKTRV